MTEPVGRRADLTFLRRLERKPSSVLKTNKIKIIKIIITQHESAVVNTLGVVLKETVFGLYFCLKRHFCASAGGFAVLRTTNPLAPPSHLPDGSTRARWERESASKR